MKIEQVPQTINQTDEPLDATTAHPMSNFEFKVSDAVGDLDTVETMLETADKLETIDESEPSDFDVAAMQQLLDGEYAELRNKIRTLLQRPDFAYESNRDVPQYREKVYEWTKVLAEEGYGALSYPQEHGGGGNMMEYVIALEMLSYHDLSLVIKFGVQFGLFGSSIHQLGTDYHHAKYLPDVGTLALPGCFAMTELGHGSNVRNIETTALYDIETQEFVINTPTDSAHKEYIGNAATHGRMATVFAQLEIDGQSYGVNAFVVPIRDEESNPMPNVRIEDSGTKLGLNGVDNGRLWFDHVRIPRAEMLNRFAEVTPEGEYVTPIENESRRFFTMLGTLVGGRVGIGLSGLSAAKSAVAIATKYGATRRQFGPDGQPETTLLDYQTHQRRLMPFIAKAYALDFGLKYMADEYHAHITKRSDTGDGREIETMAAGLKAYSTWNTTAAAQMAREACGGQGYIAANRIADIKSDTDIYTTFEGDNTVLMQLVSKGLLTEFKQSFEDINVFGILRYVAMQQTRAVSELNIVATRITNPRHLRDSNFHLAALRYRERYLLTSVAKRLRKQIKRTKDTNAAYIQCQDHLMKLANAYVERLVLEQFVAGVERCEDPSLRAMLKKLCDLYALWAIEQDKGWFLESGYIEPIKSKAIRKQVDQLCYEVSRNAVDLVGAFGIPDSVLAAPIAL